MSNWAPIETDSGDSDEEYLAHQCRRFRIMVMGKAGVGKSTLLSKVFSIPEDTAGVVHQGHKRGEHSVWRSRTSRNNPLLVIHDSGGFEAAETSNLDEIKRFVEYRASTPDLQDQLHCIWYCIGCDDARFLSEAEEKFLTFLQGSVVPIVFVLTKFDKIISECLVSRISQSDSTMIDIAPMRTQALGDARDKVKQHIKDPLEQIMQGNTNIAVVSNNELSLITQLVEQTTKVVKPSLKQLWIGAQQIVAGDKCERAIRASIKAMSTGYVRAGLLIPAPMIKPILHQDIFSRIYDTVRLQWNIFDRGLLEKEEVVDGLRTVCGGNSISFGKLVDTVGPLNGPHYIRVYLRWAADINMLFEILFWMLKEPRPSQNARFRGGAARMALTPEELASVMKQFGNSRMRSIAHTHISGRVGNFDLSMPFRRQELREVLHMAVYTGRAEGIREGFPIRQRAPSISSSDSEKPLFELP
ncbi:hypothetical protein BGZ60DRAFT_528146 [Tricladium varicosporioides]|nr:hypothetical protein BGZ60DRAFT_528146 [Hymenoscyphus varicosporioides]